jgi:YHS domain-containing protein
MFRVERKNHATLDRIPETDRARRASKPAMRRLLLLCCLLFLVAAAPVNKTVLTGVAIDGYDPVAYFTDGKAVEGSKSHEYKWNGAKWRFASAANRAKFVSDPRKYAPQYGGYCAFGVSRGYAVGIDPEAWSIVDGKLYLNYNLEVRSEWMKDPKGYIRKADVNWPSIVRR